MACKTSFELHHNFPKLAEESGFTFNTHKPRVHIDWNKIRLIDVDNLIRDRKFIIVEQHLNDILDCVLESEFDVRILDEGVLKIFRLAQLAVEYQQFCRHYLDRSVYVLREEVTALAQELDYTKKTFKEKEDEIRKSKRKTKYSCRNPLPYGNDNIAHVILQTLANKNDIFSSTTQIDNVHYNKCKYCDKVFMNQLYLKSHLSRRHSNVLENPQRDLEKNVVQDESEHSKLKNEIMELKLKLKEMEVLIKTFDRRNLNFETINKDIAECGFRDDNRSINVNHFNTNQKQTKDAEVSAHNDSDILEKLEEWKKEEHEKYNKEINLLRTQITSIVDTYKDTDTLKNDNKIIEELHETIKKQNAEITSLKEELTLSILKSKNEDIDRKKEIEAQIAFWAQQTKVQSEEYKLLLQKLDTALKQAEESRIIAESEQKRATNLQLLLEQSVNYEENDKNNKFNVKTENLEHTYTSDDKFVNVANRTPKKCNPVPNRSTLEKLHRRAQELLNQSLSSSDASSANDVIISSENEKPKTSNGKNNKKEAKITHDIDIIKANNIGTPSVNTKVYKKRTKKNKSHIKTITGSNCNQLSPVKVIRAKLTEEVNQRLLSFGVDPLKKSLPYDIFQKHKSKLQEKTEMKTKKNPVREKINHSIMSYLDNKSSTTKVIDFEDEYISPNRTLKPFSFTSVLSNVKSKALSLVKSNQEVKTDERISYDTVSKKALALLKTPPESVASSPQLNKHNSDYQSHTRKGVLTNEKGNEHYELNSNKKVRKMQKVSDSSEDCDTSTDSFPLRSTQNVNEISPRKSVRTKIEAQNRRAKFTFNECNEPRKTESDENISVLTKQELQIPRTFENTNTTAKTLNLKLVDNEINCDDNIEFITTEKELRNAFSNENINSQKQAKGVLKNASSMSSLCKKKVLFDMDAIQMKSMSESPSQSINEKSNERFEPGSATDTNAEEWDISSIENELQNYEKPIKLSTRSSAKIAQLKQSIESQLTGRNQNLSLVGAVDVLKGPMVTKMVGLSGSNTSLGSSILDDPERVVSHTPVEKSKNIIKKDATLSFLN